MGKLQLLSLSEGIKQLTLLKEAMGILGQPWHSQDCCRVSFCKSAMYSFDESLAIGDWVALTEEGAKAHRKYHSNRVSAGGAILGAAALPLALPGAFLASVGIASAGVGMAVAGTTQAVVGAAGGAGIISFIKSHLENYPEAKAIGIIKDKKSRLSGKNGYNYHVVWHTETVSSKSSWHLGVHLVRIDPPLTSAV